MTEDLTAQTWAEALGLYDDPYTIATVAPRDHEEWWLDVAAIMRGETRDPRGWRSVDSYEEEIGEERLADPLHPWMSPPVTPADVERFRTYVKELPRSSVQSLLVVLGVIGWNVARTFQWEERRPEMERRARLIMSRFPDGTRFYSNVGWTGKDPDFYQQPITGMSTFASDKWDGGLIAVNDAEIAMIWVFAPT
ncbi:hypothetical protein J7E93_21435 [Streptomyces sp. ISL-36]|uniref:hypothetical protein n=1 Tax=Streptomyces sp. ISL-36 TaxID=2819182 RepID=UPI001BECCEB2|nr:hypothetical protein [Streptomyces sp. ISL-36]MBT2442623.1 hypothetical protein [Streptomyces sp. ISL-36]